MKRFLTVVLFLVVAFAACGQTTIIYKDSPTLAWDHPDEGDPHFAWEVYTYDVSTVVADDQDIAQLSYLGISSITELAVTFAYESEWAVGVRTVFTDDAGVVKYSLITWSVSAVPGETATGPFVFGRTGNPAKPTGLKDSGM
jgi:hypothetical protein